MLSYDCKGPALPKCQVLHDQGSCAPADSNAKGNAKIPAPIAEFPRLKTAPQELVLPARKSAVPTMAANLASGYKQYITAEPRVAVGWHVA